MRFQTIPTLQQWQSHSKSFFTFSSTDRAQRSTKENVARIDELIRKYHAVLDMGKVNILMELKDSVTKWAEDKVITGHSSSRLKAMQALQEVVLRKLVEMENWSKHRYLKAVCLGFEIQTGDYDHGKKPKSRSARNQAELDDVKARVAILTQAIDQARKMYQYYLLQDNIDVDEDKKTLKIFMAPEFFFRGPYGAYRDVALASEIMEGMGAVVNNPLYEGWLFVHGSAIFSIEKEKKTSSGAWKKDGVQLENYALVQRGGKRTNDAQQYIVAKEFPSHVDFTHLKVTDAEWYDEDKPKANLAGRTEKVVRPEDARRDPFHNKENQLSNSPAVSELVGGCLFTMDGITFGLEVCRDHYLRRLASSANSKNALIQLIPSAGMQIEQSAIACAPGGIVFNVDGVTPHSMIEINEPTASAPTALYEVNSGGGKIVMYQPADIPWPGLANAQVARKLKVDQAMLGPTRVI